MQLFIADKIENEAGILGADETQHATKVLRLNAGDRIFVTDGKGRIYEALIDGFSKKELQFKIEALYSEESFKSKLHIAIAPTKNLDRFETFLEKATEVGTDEITPIFSFHSERKVYKTERGKRIIKAAAKQSISHYIPQLNEPLNFSEVIKSASADAKFIAHCHPNTERIDLLPILSHQKDALILIGPEGDFSEQEVAQAVKAGFTPVSLGSKRLRTETAAMAVAIGAKLF